MEGSITAKKIATMAVGDFKNITRDETLAFVMVAPILLALVFRYGVPFATVLLWKELYFDLRPYHAFIAGFITLIPPMMFGIVTGYMLLEERDEQILEYIAVTPFSKQGYLAYRLTIPIILSFVFTVFLLWFTKLAPFNLVKAAAVALVVALEAPVMAMFLAAFAGNKVEGLALSKGFGVTYVGPFVGYFVESKWQLLAGVLPTYWVTESFAAGQEQSSYVFALYVLAGIVVHILWVYWLYRRFKQRSS